MCLQGLTPGMAGWDDVLELVELSGVSSGSLVRPACAYVNAST
jgi:hypothetical protein